MLRPDVCRDECRAGGPCGDRRYGEGGRVETDDAEKGAVRRQKMRRRGPCGDRRCGEGGRVETDAELGE
eukprot:3375575-Rhodomonas_salina.1